MSETTDLKQAVEDGSIVRGPASRPQPAYDVRVVGGVVEVRPVVQR